MPFELASLKGLHGGVPVLGPDETARRVLAEELRAVHAIDTAFLPYIRLERVVLCSGLGYIESHGARFARASATGGGGTTYVDTPRSVPTTSGAATARRALLLAPIAVDGRRGHESLPLGHGRVGVVRAKVPLVPHVLLSRG